MSDEIPSVDAAELAELDRIARENDIKPQEPPPIAIRPKGGAVPAGTRVAEPLQPPPPLRPFVDVATVEAHLHALDAKLVALEKQTRHVMILVMLLGDRFHVTPEEYRRTEVEITKIEKETP